VRKRNSIMKIINESFGPSGMTISKPDKQILSAQFRYAWRLLIGSVVATALIESSSADPHLQQAIPDRPEHERPYSVVASSSADPHLQ